MSFDLHVTVAAVVENEGRFLMVYERDKTTGCMVYNQPAGHWDEGETLLEACVREAREETGWEIKLTHLIGLFTFTAPSNGRTYLRIAFAATPVRYLETELDADITEALWLDYETLLEKDAAGELRSPLVREVIDRYLDGQRLPLCAVYDHSQAART